MTDANLAGPSLVPPEAWSAGGAPIKASLCQLLSEHRKLAEAGDDNFNIFDILQLADTLSSTMGVLTSLLGAVTADSLLVGGIIGTLVATAASHVLSGVMVVPYTFATSINLLALLFSAFIGVVFGCFPARCAALMDPIEALRHE